MSMYKKAKAEQVGWSYPHKSDDLLFFACLLSLFARLKRRGPLFLPKG